MTIESLTTVFSQTCRQCGDCRRYSLTLDAEARHPELPLGDGIELAMHEHVEAEGWIDQLCPQCVIAEHPEDPES